MAHGFIYCVHYISTFIEEKQNWNYPTLGIILAASLVPFGTFYVEKNCKMFKSAAKIFEFLSLL
jgi:integral membrane protein